MTVWIDGDGCPVVDLTVNECKRREIPCNIVCDTSHEICREYARTLVVSKGADSVDFALVNLIHPGDLVVTQDYGLAAMCLARQAAVLTQNGMEISSENVEGLLTSRHYAKKARSAGVRMKGPAKRTSAQDSAFLHTLCKKLEGGE